MNLSIIDDDKLRKELNDIICHCDDCDINGYCDCDYPCIFRLTEYKISEIIQNSRVKINIESDEKDSKHTSPKVTFNELL